MWSFQRLPMGSHCVLLIVVLAPNHVFRSTWLRWTDIFAAVVVLPICQLV